jgi:polyribonucleotide nucleotidyltransferase
MDFKFTGTRDGITAIQMDTKTSGLTKEMIHAVFPQMRKAINEVIDCLVETIPEPRKDLSPYAPRIISFKIDPQKIGDVIGPGGKIIRAITEELDLKIDINDDGLVMITTNDVEKGQIAEKKIRDIIRVVEVDEIFEEAEVVKIMPFGAFLNLTPGQDGMLHVSEIEWARVENVTDRVNMGDKIRVKVIKIENGKVDVSRKALLPKPEGYVEPERRPRRDDDRRSGGDRRGGDRDRRPRDRDSRSRDRAPRERRPRDDGPNRDGYAGERKDERLEGIEKRKTEKKPEDENTTENIAEE